jgi:hypothetical protein
MKKALLKILRSLAYTVLSIFVVMGILLLTMESAAVAVAFLGPIILVSPLILAAFLLMSR